MFRVKPDPCVPHKHHPAFDGYEMCGDCGWIYWHKDRQIHWKSHYTCKVPYFTEWGEMPQHPWWKAYESSDTTEYTAKMSELCDPSYVLEYLVKLMEISVAVPHTFNSFGVLAMWQYFLKHHENPVLNVRPTAKDEQHLWNLHSH